jgi:hypothetical protein
MLRTVLLLVGAALLVLLLWRLGPTEILDVLSQIGWYVVPALVLGGAHHATREHSRCWRVCCGPASFAMAMRWRFACQARRFSR